MKTKVSLEVNNNIHFSVGQSLEKAITGLPLTYLDIKTKGVLKVSQGRKKTEKLFYLKQLRELFANKLRRAGYIRQLEYLLK